MADIPTSIYIAKKTWKRRPPGTPATPQKRWAEVNRDKLKAQALVRQAVRSGRLHRGRCEVCNSLRVDAHHDSYDQPLVVRWLCRSHHQQWHAALRKVADGSITTDITALIASSAPPKRKGKAA